MTDWQQRLTVGMLVFTAAVNVWIWEVANGVAAVACLGAAVLIWRRALER